ncbi:glycosyltransferase [Virgibacillus xinjiangensis]|uniref:Glycosyltransferase n=1 Tax=Virgibacillus xinjiangensis TaxID=393090 RepID=A0ABV7CSG4_9BACI
MRKILFLPLLRLPSGHHHVAESIQQQLEQAEDEFTYEKVELISHSYGRAESIISTAYLSWIHSFPKFYSMVYQYGALRERAVNKRYLLYEWLFQKKILQLLLQTRPDVVICTHALPSYLLSRLKAKGAWNGKVVNVYTDYFINNLWGIKEINYHLVPSQQVKKYLMDRGVLPDHIIVSGIPIHPTLQTRKKSSGHSTGYTIIISGGNMGAGPMRELLHHLKPEGLVHYKVLCGKNFRLYHHLRHSGLSNVQPIPYISSKQKMNELYDAADAFITKPGGITVTECLWKKIPLFVYESLPGQEEINLKYLKEHGLASHLPSWKNTTFSMEKIILEELMDSDRISRWVRQMEKFHEGLEKTDFPELIRKIITSD